MIGELDCIVALAVYAREKKKQKKLKMQPYETLKNESSVVRFLFVVCFLRTALFCIKTKV